MEPITMHVDDFFPVTLRDSISMRPLRENDAQFLFRAVDKHRDFLSQYLPWVTDTTAVHHTAEFIKHSQELEKTATGLNCGIFKEKWSKNQPVVEEAVGGLALKFINFATKKAELGYWLSKDYIGVGLCTLACKKMIEYGRTIGIHNFEIYTEENNLESQAVAHRLGFQKLPRIAEFVQVVNGTDVKFVYLVFELRLPETDLSSS